jgi:hypothetical protein
MHFTRISKSYLLLEIHFCDQAPDSFRFLTNRSLFCTQDRRKNGEDAIGSSGAADSGSGQNPASRRRGWPGKGRGGDHELTTRRFEAGSGAGRASASSLGGTGAAAAVVRAPARWQLRGEGEQVGEL